LACDVYISWQKIGLGGCFLYVFRFCYVVFRSGHLHTSSGAPQLCRNSVPAARIPTRTAVIIPAYNVCVCEMSMKRARQGELSMVTRLVKRPEKPEGTQYPA